MIALDKYIKPCLAVQTGIRGIIPLAAVGAAVAGMSAAQLAGVSMASGLAVGMAATSNSKGSNDFISYRSRLILQE